MPWSQHRPGETSTSANTRFVYMNGIQLCNAAFQQFNEFRSSGDLCDVVLCVEKLELPAHKVILAAVSPYFKAMFTGKLAESAQKRVSLRGIEPISLQLLVDFAYTGSVNIDEENVQCVLYTATLLQINQVKDACCRFLEKQLEVDNCLGIRALSDSLACKHLFQVAHKFAVENFEEVIATEEFLLQPYDSLETFIEYESLQISNEERLITGVLEWIRHDKARRDYSTKLLKRLHLLRVSPSFLKDVLLTDEVISKSSECKKLVLETIEALESPAARLRGAYEFPLFGGRYYKNSRLLFAVGGEALGVTLDSVEFFNPVLDQWVSSIPDEEPLVSITHMHQGRSYASLVTTGRHAYVIGGRSSSLQIIGSVERYELPENKWYQIPSLCSERLGAGSLVVDSQILTAGGCSNQGYLSSVEAFDVFTNKWQYSVAMSERRCYHGMVLLNNSMYAIGGFGGLQQMADNCLRSGECFNMQSETWTHIAPMAQKRAYFRAIALEGLYTIFCLNKQPGCLFDF